MQIFYVSRKKNQPPSKKLDLSRNGRQPRAVYLIAGYLIDRQYVPGLIKNNTQTAVINIINLRIIYKLDVSYARQHTFSKVTVTIFFDNYIYDSDNGSGTEIKKNNYKKLQLINKASASHC